MSRTPGSLAEFVAPPGIDMSWQQHAACRGMDPKLFFPDRGEPITDAVLTCMGCPVRAACLDYALAAREAHGVWGGYAERARRRMRRQIRLNNPPQPRVLPDQPHGVRPTYQRGCRCQLCQAAQRDYQRDRRAREMVSDASWMWATVAEDGTARRRR